MLEVSLLSHLGIMSRITLQLNHTNIKIWEHDYNTFEIMKLLFLNYILNT